MRFIQKPLAVAVVFSFLLSVIAPCAFANPQSLNLSSTTANVPASNVLNSGVVHIHVGSGGLNVSPSSMLTPAEALAVSQIVAGGRQTIQLGALGNAVGGRFLVGTTQNQTFADLLVPNKVTGIVNFLNSANLNINGALSDAGTIYAVSTNAAMQTVDINAASINVATGGRLTTVIPSSGLSGISNPTPNLALTLNTTGAIVNAGTIRTASDLTLNSATGSYTNTGTIVSQNGNVNIGLSQPSTDVTVNNSGGTIQAANSINVRDAAYSGSANTTLSGGNWLSQQLNVNGGNGTVDVNVNNVTGQLNSNAQEEHINTSTPVLKLGNNNIKGDPTYYNDNGNIMLTGDLNVSENLAIVASGDVDTNGTAAIISNGNAVTVIAGANISTAGCSGCTATGFVPLNNTPVPPNQTIGISAGNGGNIQLNNIDSSSTSGNGGNITLVAFSSSPSPSNTEGRIFLGTGTINASGAGVGGNVTVIAGATGLASSFTAGSITTNGGNVTISNATPVVPAGTTADDHGTLNNTITPGTLQNAGSVVFGDINTSSTVGPGGSVTIQNAATGTLNIGSFSNITNGVNGNIIVSGIDNAHYGNITIISNGGAGSGGVINRDNLVAANISITGLTLSTNGGTFTANGTSLTTPNGVVTLSGFGDTGGMIIHVLGVGSANQFSVSSTTLSAITAGTLLLEDSNNFTLSGAEFSIAGSAGTPGAYNLTLIGTGTANLIGTTNTSLPIVNTLDIGSNNFSVVVPGSIAGGAGDIIFVRSDVSGSITQNSGSVTMIAGGNIGNATGSLTFDLSGPQVGSDTGSGGNLTLIAGANNVTTASDGSSVQINASTGSGGNIIFGNNAAVGHPYGGYQVDTYGGPRGGTGGNVTLVAFADGSGNNGQITVPNGTVAAVETGAIAGTVNSGNLTVVAGGTSNAGATINLGNINTSLFQGVGNIFVQTATPNAPVTLDLKGSTAGGAGAITSGTFVSSAPVDGSIVVGNIGSNLVAAPAASVLNIILEAGSNATSPGVGQGTNAVTAGSIQMPFSVTANLIISTGINGTGRGLAASGYNIDITGPVTLAGANSSVFLSSLDSITSDTITTGSSSNPGGTVMLIAGIYAPGIGGNISLPSGGSIVTNGGNVILASMGPAGAINVNGNINTSSTTGAGGSIAISSGSPQQTSTITVGGNINSSGTSGGDVLLTTYNNATGAITVTGNINTSSSTASVGVGQIWLLPLSGGTGTVSVGSTTQEDNGTPAANPVIQGLPLSGAGGTTSVVFTPDGGTALTQGSVSGFSPGGFNTIQDSGAVATTLSVSVSNVNSVSDTHLLVPIISMGTYSLGNNSNSEIVVPSNSAGVPQFAFIGPSSVTIGGANQVTLTTSGSQVPFTAYFGVLNGNLSVNANTPETLTLPGTMLGTGAASIQSTMAVSITGPQMAFGNFGVTAANGVLQFTAPIVSNGQITLNASGGDISTSSTGVLLAPAVLLTASGGIGTVFTAPIITNAAVIQASTSNFGNTVNITALQSAHFDDNGSSLFALNLTEQLTNGVLTLGNINAFGVAVSTAGGSNGNIVLTGTISEVFATIRADGSIVAQSGSSLVSPQITLTATHGDIGSASLPVAISNGGNGVLIQSTSGGATYLADASSEPVTLNNSSNSLQAGTVFSLTANGNITDNSSSTSLDIQSPSISLISQTGSIFGASASFLEVQSAAGTGTGLTLFASAGGSNASAEFVDNLPEAIAINNLNGPLSATGSILIFSKGSITAVTPQLAMSAPSIELLLSLGNIGTSTNPLIVSSGTAGTQLNLFVEANDSAHLQSGNIYMTALGSDNGTTPAVLFNASAGGSIPSTSAAIGNIVINVPNGGLSVSNVSGANSVTMQVQTNILNASASSIIQSPSITLTANTGNIGDIAGGNPIIVTGGNSGVLQTTVNASAPGASAGNIYIQDNDADLSNGAPALVLGTLTASTGIFPPGGNLEVFSINGGIQVSGAIFAGRELQLSAHTNITALSTGSLDAPRYDLGATTGGIGSLASPLEFFGGPSTILAITANDHNNGKVYVKLAPGTALPEFLGSIGNTFFLTASSDLLVSQIANAYGAVPNIGILTTGMLTVDTAVSASNSLTLSGDLGIAEAGSFSISAPTVSLSALSGSNIDANAIGNVSNTTINLIVTTSTTVDTGILTPAVANVPNLTLATKAGSGADISVNTSVTAAASLTLQADGNIAAGAGTLAAPSIALTATTGNVGTTGSPVLVSSGHVGTVELTLTAAADANAANVGNVNIKDTDSDLSTGGAALLVSGSAGAGVSNFAGNGHFNVTTTAGSIFVASPGITASSFIFLNSHGSIGAFIPSSNSAALTSKNVFLIADGGDAGSVAPITAQSIDGSGLQLGGSASGEFYVVDQSTEPIVISNSASAISAGTLVRLIAVGGISVEQAGSPAISSPSINLTTSGANSNITADGTATGGAVLVNSGGTSGVTLQASAPGVVNIQDLTVENVTLGNSGLPLSAGVSFTLATAGNIATAAPAKPAISSPIISLTSTGGNVTADGTATGGPVIVVSSGTPTGLSINIGNGNGTGVINIADNSEPVTLASGSVSILQLTAAQGVTVSNTVIGTLSVITTSFTDNGQVIAPSGPVLITNSAGSPLTVNGNGTITASNGVIFTAAGPDSVTASGSLTIDGNLTINAIGGTVTASGLTINGGLTVNSNRYAPSGLTISGATVLNFPASASSIGTIINTDGNVVLNSKTIINANGKNVAIIAAGDVIANGATTINLSNKTGSGGNLVILAGYSFTPSTNGQVSLPDTTTDFSSPTVTTGGNVYLPKLTINTSSTAAAPLGTSAGNVFIVAAGGTANAGTIDVGGITATSKNGFGGNVELIGQGGVIVNGAINTSGKLGGGSVSLTAAQPIVLGSLQVQDGYLTGGTIAANSTVADAGGAVLVTKTITTSSSAGAGGNVTIQADQQITAGTITTSGLVATPVFGTAAGGAVTVESLGGFVSLGAVTTSAINPTTAAIAAGSAGFIFMEAGALITTGSLTAKGANFAGGGTAGGDGGGISISTSEELLNVPGGGTADEGIGQITVKGTINTAGGNGSAKIGGNGGGAGNVFLFSGAVSVTGVSGGNSIIATGGAAGKNGQPGLANAVEIETFSNQALPTNFNLTSSARAIPALPGGMFSVGSGVSPNGVAGNIAADQVMNKTIDANGQIFASSPNTTAGMISVTVTGSNDSINENNNTLPINIVTGTKRTLITPSEAFALYEIERFGAQNFSVNSTGTSGGIATAGPAFVNELDISDQAFTSFNVPPAISLQFSGNRVTLNLPASAKVQGTMDFGGGPTSVDYINASSAKFTPGAISSPGTLILSGTGSTWTNNAFIAAQELVIARPTAAALNFIGGPTSNFSISNILLTPSAGPGLSVTFTDNSTNAFTPEVDLGVIPMPATYTANVQAAANSASKLPTVKLTFSLANSGGGSGPVVGGTLTASTIAISGIANKVGTTIVQTPIDLEGANFSAATTMSITSTSALTIGSNNTLTAGTTSVANPTSPLNPTDIVTKGSLTLTGASGVTFDSDNTITNNGALLKITSTGTGSLLDLGSVNTFTDNGGNISILSKGNVQGEATTGQNPNSFTAVGVLNTATGGIEIGAGTTTSLLKQALSSPPTSTLPSFSFTQITPNSNGLQVLLVPNGTAGITLGSSVSAPGAIDFTNKGAIVLQTVGGSTINLQTSSFTTNSSKPISSMERSDSNELIVDADEDGSAI